MAALIIAATLIACPCSCVTVFLVYRASTDPTPTVKKMIEDQEGVKIERIILTEKAHGVWTGTAVTKNGTFFTIQEVYTDNWNTFAKWKRE